MSVFDGFLGQFIGGVLNPKGNLGDWRHASRTFALNTFRLAPKMKFLYHVAFTFSPRALESIQSWENKHKAEVGLLVKNASLPSYTALVETKKKYNRVKHIQTGIQYDPVTITLHDDNLGISTGMLEAYYRYYFGDGNYGNDKLRRAYNKAYTQAKTKENMFAHLGLHLAGSEPQETTAFIPGDSTYKGADPQGGLFKFGLDAGSTDPFFVDIQISQMTRKTYTTYTLVNPILTSWKHGDVDYGDSGTVENTITVNYEAVWYQRGAVNAGSDGNPKSFGVPEHYDTTPSPITLAGGGPLGFGDLLGGAVDLFDYASGEGDSFANPIQAAIAGVNLLKGLQGLTPGDLLSEGEGIIADLAADGGGAILGGLTNFEF